MQSSALDVARLLSCVGLGAKEERVAAGQAPYCDSQVHKAG